MLALLDRILEAIERKEGLEIVPHQAGRKTASSLHSLRRAV